MPKKRSHGDGALYEIKSRGLWRGVVDIGYGPDGKRMQKYVHAKTQREARAKLDKLRAEINEYGAPLDKNVTVEQWATHWIETVCRPTLKPSGLRTYESCVRKWIIPTIGKKRLAQLRPSDLRAVYLAIDKAGLRSMGAKAHTVMSSMLESARLDGAIGRNIAHDVLPPKEAEVERDSLGAAGAIAMLEVASRHFDGTRWWTALLTGARQGERNGATLDSIDFANHTITFRWSLTEAKFEHDCGTLVDGKAPCGMKRGGSCPHRRLRLARNLVHRPLDGRLILVRPKSGKARTVPLIPELEVALARYIESTKDRPNPHGLIWRNEDGSPITSGQDQADWRQILLEAGLITEAQALEPRARPAGTPEVPTTHWGRHTTITVLMELGVPPRVIGEIVGQATQRITEEKYQHVSSEAARSAMTAISTRFQAALEG